jgi:glycosyltransferase involved in cell wall biosynthesis
MGLSYRPSNYFGNLQQCHSHHFYSDIYALPAAGLARISRVIRTVHGIFQFSPNDGFQKTAVRYDWSEGEIAKELALEDFCNLTICVSTELQNKFGRYGFPIAKTKVIHNGVDAKRFMPVSSADSKQAKSSLGLSTSDFVIGFIGRLEPSKNPPILAEIASALRNDTLQSVKFVVQGVGPLEDSLKKQILSRHLTNAFIFRPATADVHRFFAAIDIMLVPSLTEGFPFVVLEAMSSGIPVVAAAVGGIPELIRDGSEGFLFDPTNCKSAVEKLCQLFSRGAREHIKKRSRERVIVNFDACEKVAAIESLYHAFLLER